MKDFISFIREQGVMGLAIGFILGGAVSDLVKSFINSIINPIVGLLIGSVDGLREATFNFLGANILWGSLMVSLINFIIIAAVVFYGFKGLGLDKLDKEKV